jgi:hypothetical protein
MGTLKNRLDQEDVKASFIKDCSQMIDKEVGSKKGSMGMVIKISFKAFKALKKGIVEDAVRVLFDDFVSVFDRYYDEFAGSEKGADNSFKPWLIQKDTQLAEHLLEITDKIMNSSDKNTIRGIYNKLRKTAQRHVVAAVPNIADLILQYVS